MALGIQKCSSYPSRTQSEETTLHLAPPQSRRQKRCSSWHFWPSCAYHPVLLMFAHSQCWRCIFGCLSPHPIRWRPSRWCGSSSVWQMTRLSEPPEVLAKSLLQSSQLCLSWSSPHGHYKKVKSCHLLRKILHPSPRYLSTFSWREFSLRSHTNWSLGSRVSPRSHSIFSSSLSSWQNS